MIFYRYFAAQGRETLIDTLASADPFALLPAEVVERVLALDNVPDVAKYAEEISVQGSGPTRIGQSSDRRHNRNPLRRPDQPLQRLDLRSRPSVDFNEFRNRKVDPDHAFRQKRSQLRVAKPQCLGAGDSDFLA